jgi:dTDP-glucose 4,6-dehydratase
MKASMKLLVTGGAGFIGSHFIKFMFRNYPEYRILNLDLLTYAGNLANLHEIKSHPNYHFVQGDICDQELVESLVSGSGGEPVDCIIHFAAESHVDRSIADSYRFVRTNIVGTQTLLEAARKYQLKKFVQISTDEVYGSLGPSGSFTEDTPLRPNSPYSASKAGGDLLVRAYHKTYGVPVNISRCSNNYGPNQHPEKLIPLMIQNALKDRPLPLYGDGKNIRDWLYVEDHCAAIDRILHHGKDGETYNIGGNNEWTNLQIAETILDMLNKPKSLIQFVKDRPGHDRRYAIDATKINKELGWKPKTDFYDGLKQTIKWYMEHSEWWGKEQV